jgi:hypothetical protein
MMRQRPKTTIESFVQVFMRTSLMLNAASCYANQPVRDKEKPAQQEEKENSLLHSGHPDSGDDRHRADRMHPTQPLPLFAKFVIWVCQVWAARSSYAY